MSALLYAPFIGAAGLAAVVFMWAARKLMHRRECARRSAALRASWADAIQRGRVERNAHARRLTLVSSRALDDQPDVGRIRRGTVAEGWAYEPGVGQ